MRQLVYNAYAQVDGDMQGGFAVIVVLQGGILVFFQLLRGSPKGAPAGRRPG